MKVNPFKTQAINLNSSQIELIESGLDSTQSLVGPAGSGKTTVGVERLNFLLQQGVPGQEILILVPQRNLGKPYRDLLGSRTLTQGSLPSLVTYGGLARRSIDLYWPLVSDMVDSFSLTSPPIFLTLESTLYFLASILDPLIASEGLFSSVAIQRNRLYSQILDNLNKAAVNGFSHLEIAGRLKSSWSGDPAQIKIFDDAQFSANLFRDFCYKNNLLDYSLQVELFAYLVAELPELMGHFSNKYSHLIYDNCEEDVPVAHDFVKSLSTGLDSLLLIIDQEAGYRQFLGASPRSAAELSIICQSEILFTEIFTSSPELREFNLDLLAAIAPSYSNGSESSSKFNTAVEINYQTYLPQLASWLAARIASLISAGTPEEEIVVLAPYLSDSLRFVLAAEFDKQGVSIATHRPSRALREEPATNCLLSIAALGHPGWEIQPSIYDLSLCLMQSIKDLDLIRANLLSRQMRTGFTLNRSWPDFESFPADIQERISFSIGEKYQYLIDWIKTYVDNEQLPLDHFIIKLFGELLSQTGYGFQEDSQKAEITSRLVDSIAKFRTSAGIIQEFNNQSLGLEYFKMVKSGILANQYLSSWTDRQPGKVYIAPAYTFLLSNYPVDYQFWLDVGSRGWYERIYQPLTNPQILQRYWNTDHLWRDKDEYELNLGNLSRLVTGLTRRCKKEITFCLTDTDERGYEQTGLLIQALSHVLRASSPPGGSEIRL